MDVASVTLLGRIDAVVELRAFVWRGLNPLLHCFYMFRDV
jgi:hypothetical protein